MGLASKVGTLFMLSSRKDSDVRRGEITPRPWQEERASERADD